MRLFRRVITTAKVRKRSAARALPTTTGMGMKRPPRHGSRKDLVGSVVQQFHAMSIHQRYRTVARVLQRNRNFNDDVELFFREADKDCDGVLTPHEFRTFLTSRFSLRVPRSHAESDSTQRPTAYQLKLVMLGSAIPFVGFGFVDNIIMLAAGDLIEDHCHEALHLSMLCAAAMGNTVANVVGLSLGGVIETFVRRVGIPDPMLSRAQARMSITHWCNFVASAGGIMIGCVLGMFPLLFMSHEKYEKEIIDAEKKRVLTLLAQERGLDEDDDDDDELENRDNGKAARHRLTQSVVVATAPSSSSSSRETPVVTRMTPALA